VGPLLGNYKRVDQQRLGRLGNLAPGSHTFELELGDAGWNSIFEIYSRLPLQQLAPDATQPGPLATTSEEYKFAATRDPDVSRLFDTELWARVYMPATLDHPPYPLLVFMHGRHPTCGHGENPRVDDSFQYAMSGTCPDESPIIVPNHEGYGYLADRLASWGYVVVSINANRGIPLIGDTVLARGRLVLKHLERLSEWNTFGGSMAHLGVELQGALDFSQVGLFGHSNGGEGVRAAYHFYTFGDDQFNVSWATKIRNKITFRGIFEIGPSDGTSTIELNPIGVKWNVLLPICDGDRFALEGVRPFDPCDSTW